MNNFIIVYMESFSAYDPPTKTGELHAFLTIDISLRSFPFHSAWRTSSMTHDKTLLPRGEMCSWLIMTNYKPKTETCKRKSRGTIWEPSRKTVACRKSPFPGRRAVTLNENRKPVNLTSLRMLSKPRGMIWEPLRKPPRPSTTLNIKTFETAIDVTTPVVKIEQTDDIATPTPNPSNEQTMRKYKEQK